MQRIKDLLLFKSKVPENIWRGLRESFLQKTPVLEPTYL